MKIILIIIVVLICDFSIAQTTYYETQGTIFNQKDYQEFKKRFPRDSRVLETLNFIETKGDSIIKHIRLIGLMNNYDPYAKQREYVGMRFPIEKFKNPNGTFYGVNSLKNKPTIINFWFSNCPPCIEEIPFLNNLKKEFGDSVNFIAITFDKKRTVKRFIRRKNFNFEQITDAEKQIDYIDISAYPTNLILNKEGVITHVFGMMNKYLGVKEILQHLSNEN